MKKYLKSILVTIIVFAVLTLIFFSQYRPSEFEKIALALIISIITGYLFYLKSDTEKNIERLFKAAKISKVGFWILDLKYDTLFWSNEIYDMFELDKKKFKPSYEKFLNVIHPDDRALVNDAYTKSLENKKDYAIQHRLLMENGAVKWVKEECKTDFDTKGNPVISIGIVTDITKEVEYLQKVEESEATLNSIINSTDDLIFFKDKDFNYLGCNESFLKFVGKTKEEMIGHNDFELFDEEMASMFRKMDIKMLKKNKISSNNEWVTYPDGQKYYVFTKKIPFHYNETDTGILGIARDITDIHLTQKEMEERSYIDELTKLHNRKAYNERIEELISLKKRYKNRFSMMMYDIDNFKQINDTYGHRVGDIVLVKMSKLIKSQLRENDYIFRIGGEEFVILLSETGIQNAYNVACKICKSVENNLKDLTSKTITISIGVTEANESDSEDTIFKRVDSLLYKSKNGGKNMVTSDINN